VMARRSFPPRRSSDLFDLLALGFERMRAHGVRIVEAFEPRAVDSAAVGGCHCRAGNAQQAGEQECRTGQSGWNAWARSPALAVRSEEHTSELQSRENL